MVTSLNRVLGFSLLFVPFIASAAMPSWQLDPSKSSISFTATQNNAPVTGQFKSFTGTSNFDPDQLTASKVHIVVAMNSVSTSYSDVQDTLKTADWFNVTSFPQAVFDASQFTKTGNNTYQANGTLTIRNKTVPVTLNFEVEQYSPTQIVAKGSTTLKRSAFGVGQGEWSSTDSIKDQVNVQFNVTAVPAK